MAPSDDTTRSRRASVIDQLDRGAVSGRWEWARKLDARVALLEGRSRWALRIASSVLAGVTALGLYARDALTDALEQRGEDRVRAVVLAEERAQLQRQGVELQLLRVEIADLRGQVRGLFPMRLYPGALTPDPKDSTP